MRGFLHCLFACLEGTHRSLVWAVYMRDTMAGSARDNYSTYVKVDSRDVEAIVERTA